MTKAEPARTCTLCGTRRRLAVMRPHTIGAGSFEVATWRCGPLFTESCVLTAPYEWEKCDACRLPWIECTALTTRKRCCRRCDHPIDLGANVHTGPWPFNIAAAPLGKRPRGVPKSVKRSARPLPERKP